ncbi:MAG: hypothetical protein M3170_09485 [Candidatus Dormibacteraeota bacterium]|nr:hypothetical protein [Candidatus Dormibacteraeota bacterium]
MARNAGRQSEGDDHVGEEVEVPELDGGSDGAGLIVCISSNAVGDPGEQIDEMNGLTVIGGRSDTVTTGAMLARMMECVADKSSSR